MLRGSQEPDTDVLRILHLVQRPQRRGAEVFAFQLAAELRRQDCEVQTAYLYPYTGEGALKLGEHDVCLGGAERHLSEKLIGFHPHLLQRVTRSIRDFRPDIVQANGARTLKYGALAAKLAGRGPWALVYRNIAEPDRWLAGWRHAMFYRRMVMPNVDGIVGVSDVTLAKVCAMYPVQVPTARIPSAVDGADLQPVRTRAEVRLAVGTAGEAPVAVFVGSLAPEKRPDRLLRVFGGIRREMPDAHLWIVGDGPLHASMARQIAEDGLGSSVSLLGVQEHVADFLRAADLMLLTSDTEGTPAAVLEAGAVGVPVVATRVGGLGACVLDGETALLVDPDDEPALVDAAVMLLSDKQTAGRFGAAAQAWVSQNFALDAVTREYVNFYHEVLSIRVCR